MNAEDDTLTERHITELVRRFYERASADDGLQAIFESVIDDWDAHHRVVENFWSRTLLQTDRYQGTPYPLHARLPLRPELFESWLNLFRKTALETLPAEAAEHAIARAEHMAESFKAGMFHGYDIRSRPSLGKPAA
ncbi:group III truncated hemoglobin [Candidatus Methylospira mobilis]|uniref:Group III truncated hemoglobin n=1 Tax=Candidatus Methylospira mobilis TaxID=1808979 RepID=A0A5Q0BFC4_9GAMM|nr:group III truncated hemoglobin [Candidatus Methylospira mobilis]QFY41832.1 group III truncated hemoglobin [Candidatus Methylospira mobilis]WNV06701.1 group III truncated hemoglobin [Candidatus Methylospira mobilis]